jgi:hypothetical protein
MNNIASEKRRVTRVGKAPDVPIELIDTKLISTIVAMTGVYL